MIESISWIQCSWKLSPNSNEMSIWQKRQIDFCRWLELRNPVNSYYKQQTPLTIDRTSHRSYENRFILLIFFRNCMTSSCCRCCHTNRTMHFFMLRLFFFFLHCIHNGHSIVKMKMQICIRLAMVRMWRNSTNWILDICTDIKCIAHIKISHY